MICMRAWDNPQRVVVCLSHRRWTALSQATEDGPPSHVRSIWFVPADQGGSDRIDRATRFQVAGRRLPGTAGKTHYLECGDSEDYHEGDSEA